MKNNLIFLLLMAFSLCGFSQTAIDDGWVEIGNVAYSSTIYDATFTDASHGYAVGSGGSYLTTTDGGATWNASYIGVDYSLYEIVFSSSNIGYIRGGHRDGGGYFGKILKTTDGGATWTEVLSNPSTFFETMSVRSDTVVWVGDYEQIKHTVNGGANWISTSLIGFYTVLKLGFEESGNGFIISANSTFHRSVDDGQTWDSAFAFPGDSPQDFNFADAAHGFLLSYNRKLAVSNDSGNIWAIHKTLPNMMKDLAFFNDSTGYFLDYYGGVIYKTQDTASSLQISYSNPQADLNGLHKMSDGSLLATGSGGLIIRTLNGVVWDTLHIGEMNTTLTDIAFVNNQIGFATGTNGYICKTINGGLNWTPEQINQGEDIGGICIATTDRIIAACNDSAYFVSVDTCQTWTQYNYGIDMGVARGIVRASATQSFAYGSEGMFITNDAGLSWVESGSYSQVYSGFTLNSDSAFFGFNNAGIRYTYDGGATYTDMITSNYTIQGIYFLNADTGIFVNSWGRLHRTTDRGLNWSQELNTGISLQDVYFVDDTLGYAMGDRGQLYKTTDQGQNWQLIETGTMRPLYKMWFTADGTGFIVGGDGIVLRKSAVPVFDVDFVVLNDDGDTLSNAAMKFNNIDYPAGILSVQGLAADSYNYIINCPGHRSDTGVIVLTSDTVLTVELKKYHNVTFRLSNVYSDFVGNAGVDFNGDSLITNASGEAVFTGVLKATGLNYEILEMHYLPQNGNANILGDTVFEITLSADIAAPVPQTVTTISDHSFTALWSAGTNASEYALFVSDDNFISVLPGYDSVVVTALNYDVNGLTPGQNYFFRLRSVNIYGYSDYSASGSVTTTTGINDETINKVVVYPVPAIDFVTVILSGNFFNENILLIDASGRTVLERKAEPEFTLNLSGLESGLYYIKAGNNVCRIIKN